LSFFNESVYKATQLTSKKRAKLFEEFSLSELIGDAVKKRKSSLENADNLWKIATNNFENNGIEVFFADNGNQVNQFILSKISGDKLVIKGKSLTTEEIRLRQFLEKNGFETVETDLGEWIIQLNNQLPSHFTAPAVHLSKEEVADIVNKELGTNLPSSPEAITKFVRKFLRKKFESADVGIIGANFIISEAATIMAVSNEGNVSLSARLPKKVFVVVGYDRIYDNFSGIENLQRLLTASATGQEYTSYIDFIKSPLPHQKITLIVLDNGRKKLLASKYKDVARCIRCASCLNSCPIYEEVGGHVFGEVYHGGIGSLLTAFTGDKAVSEKIASYCSRCSACEQYCPMEIQISTLVSQLAESYYLPRFLKIPLKLMGKANFKKQVNVKNALFIGCAFRTPFLSAERKSIEETAKGFFSDKGGVEIINSGCCGMPHFYKGELEESKVRMNKLVSILSKFDNVYIPCSSGYLFLKEALGDKLKLMSTVLYKSTRLSSSTVTKQKEKVFYHLPCHFKNEEGRKEFSELEKSIDFDSWEQEKCCGSAGTFFISHPILSNKILKRKSMKCDEGFKIITSCPSCIIQLRRLFGKEKVLHTVRYLSENK